MRILLAILLVCHLYMFSGGIPHMLPPPAKVTESISDGSWCVGAPWSNGAPDGTKDNITISGDSINATCFPNLVIGATTVLHISGCGTLVVQNIQINNGAVVTIDACCTLIVLGNLVNNNNSTNVTINGNLTVNGTLNNGTGADIAGSGTIQADTVTGSCCIMGIDPIDIPGGSTITDSILVDLPVSFIYMKLSLNYDEVIVEWSTASERNNSFFMLEKSSNLNEWAEVANMPGMGNSYTVSHYLIRDKYEEDKIYYKLSQTDYDGKTELLTIKALNANGLKPNKQLRVKPNPVRRNEYILICCTVVEHVDVFTISGQSARYTNTDNIFKFYSTGVYLVRINDFAECKIVVN